MDPQALAQFDELGAMLLPGAALPVFAELAAALGRWPDGEAGTRIAADPAIGALLAPGSVIGAVVAEASGKAMHPVRAIYFDKNDKNNWALGWHQDRTIAVKQRVEVEGYGPWTTKQGILHVQPPFAVIAGLRTIRIHFDLVASDNGPLLIASGSHRRGLVASDKCDDVAANAQTVACLADPGDVWIYHTAILHASERSRPGTRRRVLQVDYAAEPLPAPLEWLGI